MCGSSGNAFQARQGGRTLQLCGCWGHFQVRRLTLHARLRQKSAVLFSVLEEMLG